MERSPEAYAKYCALREEGRSARDVADLALLAGVQRSTLPRFERSFKAGAQMPIPPKASNPGPSTLGGRSPKASKAGRARKKLCRICLQPADLDDDGKCADREACESVAVPMF